MKSPAGNLESQYVLQSFPNQLKPRISRVISDRNMVFSCSCRPLIFLPFLRLVALKRNAFMNMLRHLQVNLSTLPISGAIHFVCKSLDKKLTEFKYTHMSNVQP